MNDSIDGQETRGSVILLLALATLAMVGDGFDISAMGLVGPQLVKEWHIAPGELAPVFTSGLLGMLFGGPLLGLLGDVTGRKKAMLAAMCLYGAFTLVTTTAGSLNQFLVLRFVTGIGLGGMIPNVMALTAEIAPRRHRGMFSIIVLFGVPAGIALPGLVAARFVPLYGWQFLLFVGGVLPLVIAAMSAFAIRESQLFLAQRGRLDEKILRASRDLRADLPIESDAHSSVAPRPGMVDRSRSARRTISPTKLFAGDLSIITPMLWIALTANQMANFFMISWLPTLLQSAGLSTAEAGISSSMFAVGGLAGGIALIFIFDRLGVIPIIAFFVVGAPLAATMGVPGLTPTVLMAIVAATGLCVTGNNYGLNSALALIYPTAVRSLGTGWAQGMGRLGSLAAPIVGGILLKNHVPTRELYFAPASALTVGAIACALLAVPRIRRCAGFRLDEVATAER